MSLCRHFDAVKSPEMSECTKYRVRLQQHNYLWRLLRDTEEIVWGCCTGETEVRNLSV